MPTDSLRLAIEIADAADRAAGSDQFDVEAEAHRLVVEHPEAPVSEDVVVDVLREEAERPAPV
ncbi:MAG: hypothetical protein U1E59_12375 [Amaricoccus sp.]